jgi:tRNA(fMet)-specific endonuclease VapC
MNRYLLDTDTVSYVLSNHPLTAQRLSANQNEAAISIVTVQEVFNGWVGRLNTAKTIEEIVFLYDRLSQTMIFFREIPILNFDEKAAAKFKALMQSHPQLNKHKLQKDMRIAAIALANNAIVVTRNHRDFSLVPGLTIIDWSAP